MNEMNGLLKTVFAVLVLSFAVAAPVFAQAHVDGHFDVKVHLDRVVDSEEPDGKVYEGYSDSHFGGALFLGKGFSVSAELLVEGEPSGHAHGHDDEHEEDEDEEEEHDEDEHEDGHDEEGEAGFFTDHTVSLDAFALSFEHSFGDTKAVLYGGKFRPIVGANEHEFPGVYSYRMIHDYEMEPRIGFGGRLGFDGGEFGKHGFDFSAFAADTTIFGAGSRLRKSDGGVSNTGDLSSFALSFGGGDFFLLSGGLFSGLLEGFFYRFGYARQAKGVTEDKDEQRFAVMGKSVRQITGNLSVSVLSEYINIKNQDGHEEDFSQSSTAVAFDWKKRWTVAGGGSFTGSGHSDSSYSFSVSRKFGGSAKIGAGYQSVKEDGERTGRVGVLLSYHGDFSSLSGDGHEGHNH